MADDGSAWRTILVNFDGELVKVTVVFGDSVDEEVLSDRPRLTPAVVEVVCAFAR